MTPAPHGYGRCDSLITDADDAVRLGQGSGISGTDRDVWAHHEHAYLVSFDPTPLAFLTRCGRIQANRRCHGVTGVWRDAGDDVDAP
ncbi:hypothetical protein [Streptomyces sp. GQFP]|uniref:hypothetical protein n=1 Tax=Streptomyces sp. GQFP TaxID=2907545 RepID=UPI001F1D7E10|nr:hypothetical protein [Streptomyces sp. GQFP]UIX35003.1 hypothetical protein LUX31_36160 [Streptomyces sp. GQFP]